MIRYTIEKHGYGFPSKVLAGYGGDHIYNIQLTKDHDNATLVGRGEWVGFDEYKEAEVTSFAAEVRQKAANGNWYIEVTAETDALFVFDSAIIAEDYNNEFKKECNFFNEKGKTVKAYSLNVGDILEVSPELFTGTVKEKAKITSYTGDKYTIA